MRGGFYYRCRCRYRCRSWRCCWRLLALQPLPLPLLPLPLLLPLLALLALALLPLALALLAVVVLFGSAVSPVCGRAHPGATSWS